MDEKMTREEAFRVLNLDPDSDASLIKKKYENYMRRAKFDDSFDEQKITKAYDALMGINWGNFTHDPAYDAKGINKKKIENFFYHNKRALLFGVPLGIMIIATVLLVVLGRVRYDYKISLLGRVSISDQDAVAEYYQELLGLDAVMIDYYVVGEGESGEMSETYMYKLSGDLQGAESDFFICAPGFAKYLSYDGGLMDLTPYLAELGISPDDENILYWYKEDGTEMAAAYKFGSNSIFPEGIDGKVPEYFCIPHRAEFSEETKTVIMDLLEQNR